MTGSHESSRQTVLIAEDDRLMRRYLEAQLEPLGVNLAVATTGPEVFQQIEKVKPDVLLLDVVLPGQDGFDICRRIKGDPNLAHIVVVHLTSLGRDAKDRSFESGADDFLTKPPHLVELRTRVKNHLRVRRMQVELQREMDTARTLVWDIARPARVLVVASHPNLLQHMASEIGALGHDVQQASSLQEAMPFIGTGLADLVVLDQHLSDGTALPFTRQLRTARRTRDLPILLVCARQNLDAEVQEIEPGPTDYLTKPFLPSELRLRVGAMLRHASFHQGTGHGVLEVKQHFTDGLTGAYNGPFFEAHLDLLLRCPLDPPPPLELVGLRLRASEGDWQHGLEHLASAMALIKARLRGGDMLARVSDRTFVVLLPGFNPEESKAWVMAVLKDGWDGWGCPHTPRNRSARAALEVLAEGLHQLESGAQQP